MQRWSIVLDLLKDSVGEKDFTKWIKPTRLIGKDQNTFVVEAPNNFIRTWLQNYYEPSLKQALGKIYGQSETGVRFVLPEKIATPTTPVVTGHAPKELARIGVEKGDLPVISQQAMAKSRNLDPNYTFDSFVVGSSNQFAHAASMAVAEQPGKTYNPLFIYGGVGLGKTHLLHAIGLHLIKARPDCRVVYMSSERFINDLINSLRLKKMDDFRRRYRNTCDALLIDDIQFIAGKERSQEEFFHTFNALHELGCQIVMTSDKVPKDIQGLEERLCSRFEWGLIADIQPPELETRIAILKKKAEAQNIPLANDVAHFIAGSIINNIRELEGALVRLTAYASLTGKEVDLEFAQEIFRDIIKPPRQIDIAHIQKTVANAYNIKTADLCSARKFKYIALPRQVAMYFARKLTNASFPDIGNKFGGKDHSTVVHAVRKIENQLAGDTSLRNTLESLEKTIRFGSQHPGV